MKLISLLIFSSLLFINCKAQEASVIAAGAELQMVSDGYTFTEGPATDKNGNVYFTDQPNDQILKWTPNKGVEVYLKPSGRANGLYFDNDGNLIACADEKFQLREIDKGKNVKIIWERFNGKDFNGPNDLWIAPNGGLYFTDPYYQRPYWERTTPQLEKQLAYYITPDYKTITVFDGDLVKPNGIIGSADGKTLYISDKGADKTYKYTIDPNGNIIERKLFCELGSDGMALDNRGNLYLTGNGVTIFNSKGEQIASIPTGKNWTSNVTFGGPDRDLLFITAMDAVFTLKMNTKGDIK